MPFESMYHNWPNADSDANSYYVRKKLLFLDETYTEILDAVRRELVLEDTGRDQRVSFRFRTEESLEAFRDQRLRGLADIVRQANKQRVHPVRYSSSRISRRFCTCDLFFVPAGRGKLGGGLP